MGIRTTAKRPTELSFALVDRSVVDTGDTSAHQSVLVELPVFVAVTAKPLAGVVVPLVGEAHCNAVLTKGPELLDEAIIQLTVPLLREKGLDGISSAHELGAASPATIQRTALGHRIGVSRIPCIFGQPRPLRGGFARKRGQRRAGHG